MKKAFRKEVLARRAAVPAEERAAMSRLITEAVLTLPEVAEARVISVYVDFRNEVETRELINRLLAMGKTVALPVVDFDAWEMRFTAIESLDCLIETEKHLMEPAPGSGQSVPITALELILAPGAAFNRQGYRMGYGGGFYDRLLQNRTPGTPAIALGFGVQLVDDLPVDVHDQRLDALVTEEGILRF